MTAERRRLLARPLAIGVVLPGLLIVLFASNAVHAVEPSTLTLRDGSSITGEVVSLSDGVYTVRSATLGTVTVKAADVRSLTNEATATGPAPAQLDGLQERIASDPDTMNAINTLRDDPELKAMLDDPELQSALQSGNLDALLSNPKLARFAADPRVQEITKKVSH
ncbi:MAG TPA: hypothetical protein VN812_21375 [Candidatus Acidoferrales bacterium]|nr:hypothetical protein [Candidatus Acidoferrales bacterium]